MAVRSILDPRKLKLSVLGFSVKGFSAGSFVTITRDKETFNMRRSLKGRTLVERNKFGSYILTFRLQNTSEDNTWLHSLYKLQELYGVAFPVPVVYRDMNGDTAFYAASGIIQEPRTSQGNEVETIEWTIFCPNAINTVGGSEDNKAIVQILRVLTTLVSTAGLLGIDLSNIASQAQSVLDKGKNFVGGLFT